MDQKTKEMIALGVSYGINCTYCMEYHKREAIKAGLTGEEMLGAINVAEQVKNGAASKTKTVAAELFGEVGNERCCPVGSECCP